VRCDELGRLGEAAAAKWFTEHGYTVLFPLGDGASYDFAVDDGSGLLRVQVKSRASRDVRGRMRFELVRRQHKRYDGIDLWALYNAETDEVRVVTEEERRGRVNIYWEDDDA
jgi:Holliday junction resolvase-like predicted endonuclease